jgi:hypothetical protein
LPAPAPGPKPGEDEKEDKRPKPGRIYVTYTKFNTDSKQYYSGRTSAVVDLKKPLLPQALLAVRMRDTAHHVDEKPEPQSRAFQPAVLDRFAVGTAVNYSQRYEDEGYRAIRGREQQLIDHHGGARSDTRPGPNRTENAIRGVAKDHQFGKIFHEAANRQFGQLHPYTGN